MRFAIFGSGAVGGYTGAKLARAGHEVVFFARGAHLQAIRDRGLTIKSPLGDFTVHARAESDPARVGPVDVVLFAVKCYSNAEALPQLRAMVGGSTAVLTLQNGVDSVDEVAATVGESATLGGSTYVATALEAPGLIVQTGTHRRVVFGEAFVDRSRVSDRVAAINNALVESDIESQGVADVRSAIWEKFVYLSPFAGFTGATRLPIGPLWAVPDIRQHFLDAALEVKAVAAAEGVSLPDNTLETLDYYVSRIPGETRSSLLIDFQQGKPIEVEALQGAVVRRGKRAGVPTPILATLYAVLKPHERGNAAL